MYIDRANYVIDKLKKTKNIAITDNASVIYLF